MVSTKELSTKKKNTWCPGCGNFGILMAFKRALTELILCIIQFSDPVYSRLVAMQRLKMGYFSVSGIRGRSSSARE